MAINFKRTKKGFNGMDLFILIVIAVVIAAAVFIVRGMGNGAAGASSSGVTIEYTVEFAKINNSVIGALKEGDSVTDPDNKQNIGTVVAVQSVPYSELIYNDNDGSVYMAENPDISNLLITVRAEAVHSDAGYYVNGARFLVGRACNVWSRGFAGNGYCINIREID